MRPPAPLTTEQRLDEIDRLHQQWEADPPSIRELMEAPMWALRAQDRERVLAWVTEHPEDAPGGRCR